MTALSEGTIAFDQYDPNGVMRDPTRLRLGVVVAVVVCQCGAETTPMLKDSKVARAVPGCNVYRLRAAQQLSQRALAEKCNPSLDHTTINRLERNQGYTQDTLERVATALGVSVQEFFLPAELADWPHLPVAVRRRVAESVQDYAIAAKYRPSV